MLQELTTGGETLPVSCENTCQKQEARASYGIKHTPMAPKKRGSLCIRQEIKLLPTARERGHYCAEHRCGSVVFQPPRLPGLPGSPWHAQVPTALRAVPWRHFPLHVTTKGRHLMQLQIPRQPTPPGRRPLSLARPWHRQCRHHGHRTPARDAAEAAFWAYLEDLEEGRIALEADHLFDTSYAWAA